MIGAMRQVILYPGEDGMWVAEVPSLPGCVSQGATRDETLRNMREAIELWIETMTELGEPIPPDTGGAEIAHVPDPAA